MSSRRTNFLTEELEGRGQHNGFPGRINITFLDFFFFFGYVNARVFTTSVQGIDRLRIRITDDGVNLTAEMLENTG